MKKNEDVQGGVGFINNHAYTVVLKSGSTHNFILKRTINSPFSSNDNFVLVGNIAIEKVAVLEEKRADGGKCDIEFGFWNDISKKRDLNVIQTDRIFVCVPISVFIPSDNIGLVEESAFPHFESEDVLGEVVIYDDKIILEKLPHWKHYYSTDLGGFFSTPPIIKGQFPNKEWSQSISNKFSVLNAPKDNIKDQGLDK